MSSYSYMVIPTTTDAPFNTDKGKTLSTFINYFLCQGQQKADILGYSPLPKNLVLAGFDQVKRIPGAVASPVDRVLQQPGARHPRLRAPQPDPCTKAGATGCGTGATTNGAGASNHGGGNGSGGGATAGATGGATEGATTDTTGTYGSGDAVDPLGGAAAPAAADPLAGGAVSDPTAVDTSGAQGVAAAPGAVVQLAGGRDGQGSAAAWIGVVVLALTVLTPPFLLQRHRRRR